jgi:23S rRNA-/tRNA-specific pseudouridylate synthase
LEPVLVHVEAGVCVVFKPAGMAMHTGTGVEDEADTLVGWVRAHAEIERDFSGPSFLGRLDRATSGLVIGALTRDGLRAVEPAWSAGEIEKGYLAIVHGRPAEGGVIDIPLAARRARHRGTGRVEEARTAFWALERPSKKQSPKGRSGLSLVLAFPITGRTHQLRRHFKAIGHPILGDTRYGDRSRDGAHTGGLMLHCWRFRAPTVDVLPDVVTATPPQEFLDACNDDWVDLDDALAHAQQLSPPSVDA